jgi:hypothetical protein
VSSLSPRIRKEFALDLCVPFHIIRTRHDSCAVSAITYTILNPDGQELGSGVIGVRWSENLSSSSWRWGLNVRIGMLAASGDVAVGTVALVGILCVNCTATLPFEVPLPVGKVWSHTFGITARGGAVTTTRQYPDVQLGNPAAKAAPPVILPSLGPARCDKLAWTTRTSRTQGCVFSDVAAAYLVYLTRHNMNKVARNILNGERTKPHHFGWFGHGSPLTRANNTEIQNANRRAACGRTHFHRPWSCDEYPFADSYQGAFFFPHDYTIAQVLQTENSTEGQARQNFYKNERVISAPELHILDRYWVVVLP